MSINKVNEIPKREYRFTMSERTKEYVLCLQELGVGEVLQVCPEKFTSKSDEVQLREIRDCFKTATKKVSGEFLVRRRKGCYYVKKLSSINEVEVSQ